jgi:hypothetical protein
MIAGHNTTASVDVAAYEGCLACVVACLQVRSFIDKQLHGFLPPKFCSEVQRSTTFLVCIFSICPAGEQSAQPRDVTISCRTAQPLVVEIQELAVFAVMHKPRLQMVYSLHLRVQLSKL